MRERVVPQRGINLDYVMWLFMRISGLFLLLLSVVGVVGAALMGTRNQVDLPTLLRWAYFPNPNHVINSEIPDVDLWATAYWQVMQILVIFFGVTHGMNGLRNVLEDYVGNSFFQIMLRGFLFLLWLGIMIVAVYLALTSYVS